MTGFARREGRDDGASWVWEVKSVNGRSLDVRCRLAPGMDMLEPDIRGVIEAAMARGHVSVALKLARTTGQVRLRINEAALTQVMAAVAKLEVPAGIAPPGLDGLLRLNGITEIEETEDSEDARQARISAMMADLSAAVADLCTMRAEEGARLARLVETRLDRLEELVAAARAAAESQPQAIRERLMERLDDWLEARPALPEERLAQEVALLAAKADVAEELDRLDSHITAARALLAAGGAIGRRLDFLSQELSREANTLCAKAAARDLGDIGLEIKVVADQIREQIQNIE